MIASKVCSTLQCLMFIYLLYCHIELRAHREDLLKWTVLTPFHFLIDH